MPELEKIRRRYGCKLRRSQAIALFRELGCSEHTFRTLIAAGQLHRHSITGKQSYFDREQIITLLS